MDHDFGSARWELLWGDDHQVLTGVRDVEQRDSVHRLGWRRQECSAPLATVALQRSALPDMAHRLWNDTQLGIRRAKLWHGSMLKVCVLNLDSGPYDGASWWEQLEKKRLRIGTSF